MDKTPTLVLDDKTRRMIDQMIIAEQRHLAKRHDEEACACREGMFPRDMAANRRSVLFAAGSSAAAAAMLATAARAAYITTIGPRAFASRSTLRAPR